MRNASKTVELHNRPPATVQLLQNRANDDLDTLNKVIRSRGYYGGAVTAGIKEDSKPIQILFTIDLGPAYRLSKVDILFTDPDRVKNVTLPDAEALGLIVKETADPEAIVSAQNRLLTELRRQGFPFPTIAERKVVVDHATRSVSVTFEIDPGRVAVFGVTRIAGLTSVHESYVRNRIRWTEDELFNSDRIAETQKELIESDLFAVVRINQATEANRLGQVPMAVLLEERKHRSVGAGLNYQTNEGPGGHVSWEHRNMFGEGERLSTEAEVSGIEYSGSVRYRKPDFLVRDQALLAELRVGYDHPEPYTSRNIATSVLLERELNEDMLIRGGISYRIADITQLGRSEEYGLFSLPFQFEWDFSDDLLNPTTGGRLRVNAAPFFDTFGTSDPFFKSYAKYSHYFPISDKPDFVLATQIGLGSIVGSSLLTLPADERFYAGGGGSIRGYTYQTVSPLIGDDPIGGSSILEMSVEFRFRVTETLGFVTFIDGGNAFESEYPDFSNDIQWGAGVGFRYYTGIGPIRFDIAMPLNKRDIDDPFQLYVSLGQAF